MSFTPLSGPAALLKLGASPATACAMNWKLNIDAKLVDASNFQYGRQPVATLTDVDFEFAVVWDQSTRRPTPTWRTFATARRFRASATPPAASTSRLSAVIGTLAPGVDSLEDYLKMPITAKISGTLTYPINLS